MVKKIETGLIVVKETAFDKIRRKILNIIYGRDYIILQEFENLMKTNRPKNIIIPKSINFNKGKK